MNFNLLFIYLLWLYWAHTSSEIWWYLWPSEWAPGMCFSIILTEGHLSNKPARWFAEEGGRCKSSTHKSNTAPPAPGQCLHYLLIGIHCNASQQSGVGSSLLLRGCLPLNARIPPHWGHQTLPICFQSPSADDITSSWEDLHLSSTAANNLISFKQQKVIKTIYPCFDQLKGSILLRPCVCKILWEMLWEM